MDAPWDTVFPVYLCVTPFQGKYGIALYDIQQKI